MANGGKAPASGDSAGTPQNLNILLVENDPAAVLLTKEAFREAGLMEGVRSVPDGDEALACLRREKKHANHPRPDLIFLDLHLPKKSGLEVLAEIKGNPKLLVTPVVVVSGSANPQEIREAYELHASCYVRKPDDLHNFLKFIRICFEFWGEVVTLPPKTNGNSK
jgi:CheY-like chemotaxis protein